MTKAVFDQTINRAAEIKKRFGLAHLAIWHEKTRIASRVSLHVIYSVLESRPNENWFWVGGENGSWQPDEP
jgi:hypothetical protein